MYYQPPSPLPSPKPMETAPSKFRQASNLRRTSHSQPVKVSPPKPVEAAPSRTEAAGISRRTSSPPTRPAEAPVASTMSAVRTPRASAEESPPLVRTYQPGWRQVSAPSKLQQQELPRMLEHSELHEPQTLSSARYNKPAPLLPTSELPPQALSEEDSTRSSDPPAQRPTSRNEHT